MKTLITSDLITRVSNLHDLAQACRETGKPGWAEYYDKTALDVLRGVRRENMAQLADLNPRVAQRFAVKALAEDMAPAFKRIGNAVNTFFQAMQKGMSHDLQKSDLALQA